MGKKRLPRSFADTIQHLYAVGLKHSDSLRPHPAPDPALEDLDRVARLEKLLEILHKNKGMKTGNVLTFIMYDIENNRVRRYLAKYLEQQGYVRVQKSVFFGNVPRTLHKRVTAVLKEVNAQYDNGDSIMILPVSIDMFNNLHVVGKNLSYELVVEERTTLFF